MDDTETEEVSDDMFQDGLRVDDVQRINLNFDENSVRIFFPYLKFSSSFSLIFNSKYFEVSRWSQQDGRSSLFIEISEISDIRAAFLPDWIKFFTVHHIK